MITRHAAPARSPAGPWLTVGTAGALCLLAVIVMSSSTSPAVPARDAPPVGGTLAAAGGPASALYRYAKDSANPSRSACTGGCAKTWPPLLDSAGPALAGVARTRIGTLRRPDGTRQVTLDGWPLYRFAKDVRPGDTKGDGVGGAWQAVVDAETTLAAARTPKAAPVAAAPGAASDN